MQHRTRAIESLFRNDYFLIWKIDLNISNNYPWQRFNIMQSILGFQSAFPMIIRDETAALK